MTPTRHTPKQGHDGWSMPYPMEWMVTPPRPSRMFRLGHFIGRATVWVFVLSLPVAWTIGFVALVRWAW